MKIAFDHQVFTMQRYGGISRYFFNLIEGLQKINQQPKVFAGVYQNQYLPKLDAELYSGYPILKYPKGTGRFFNLGNHYFTQNQIKRFAPDIIHETYYSQVGVKDVGIPRVVTVYDMIHELFPESFPKNDPLPKWKRRALENADHIISISHHTKADLIKLFDIPESKISVVHLASNFVSKGEIKVENKISKPFVLYVGAREDYKNFDILLKAFSKSKKINQDYSLIAFGGGGFNSSEMSRIKELGLSLENIKQQSGNDQMLYDLYSSASVFVYPSKYEGFGLPPLEAMACGCPVISSNTSSMPEVIGNAAEFFSPLNLDELIDSMERVLYQKEVSNDLIDKGNFRIKEFSWEKCALETLEVYQKVSSLYEK